MDLNKVQTLFHEIAFNRSRFGIWCCESSDLGDEPNIAVRLGADPVNFAAFYKQKLDPQADFIGLDDKKITGFIAEIANSLGKLNVLVYNLDLLLARMSSTQRNNFWENLFCGLVYHQRSLVILLPRNAEHLLPQGEARENWLTNNRMIGF